jgi:deoxycytidine triphosphate deaminase
MALSNHDIALHKNRRIVIEPFEEDNCTPAGYDLRIGFAILLEQDAVVGSYEQMNYAVYQNDKDLAKNDPVKIAALEKPKLHIPPMQSVAIATKERVYLTGRILGTVFAKASVTAQGFGMNSFTVDPTYKGRLYFRLKNETQSTLEISLDQGIATLVLETVETETQDLGKTATGNSAISKYGDVKAQLMNYNDFYESVHRSGAVAFDIGVKEADRYRNRPIWLRKTSQYFRQWKLRKKNRGNLRGFFEIALVISMPILDILFFANLFFPNGPETILSKIFSPQAFLALVALNFGWFNIVRTLTK